MYYISQKEIFKGHMAKQGAELGFRLCYLKPSAHIFSLEKLLLVVVRRGVGGVRVRLPGAQNCWGSSSAEVGPDP